MNMDIECTAYEEERVQLDAYTQRVLQSNPTAESDGPINYNKTEITQNSAIKQEAATNEQKGHAGQTTFKFTKSQIHDEATENDQLKVQVFTQESIENILLENQSLKQKLAQYEKKLNLIGGTQSSSSEGTQEQEIKKNPEHDSFTKNRSQTQSLEPEAVENKGKAITQEQLEAIKIKLSVAKSLNDSYEIKLKQSQDANRRLTQKLLKSEIQSNQEYQKGKRKLEKRIQLLSEQLQVYSSLTQKIDYLREALEDYQNKYGPLESQRHQLFDQSLKNSDQIFRLKDEKQTFKAKMASVQDELDTTLRSSETDRQTFNLLIAQKQGIIQKNEKALSSLEAQNTTLLQKIQTLEASLQKLRKQAQKSSLQIKELKQTVEKMKLQTEKLIKKNEAESKELKGEIEKLKQQIGRMKQQIEKSKQQFEKLKKEKESQKVKLQTEIKGLTVQKQTLIKQLKKEAQQKLKVTKAKQAEKIKLQAEITALKANISTLTKQLAEQKRLHSMDCNKLEKIISESKRQCQQLASTLKEYQQALNPILEVSALSLNTGKHRLFNRFLRGSCFPDSQILNKQDIKKSCFLYRQLTQFLQIPTFKTQLVFKYDPLNPQNNFFKYIFGKKHMMLLVKLLNGTIVGGFSLFPFEEKPEKPGKGFIFSLTAEKAFKMKKQPRVGVYNNDTFFLIIGSSELRIKYTEKKFFSNFGVASGTFEANGFTKQQFLGVVEQNISEVEFESYEIFTIQAHQE